MYLAALLLAAIGVADLFRAADAHRAASRIRSILAAIVVAIAATFAAGYGWGFALLVIVVAIAWVTTTSPRDDKATAWPPVVLLLLVTASLASAAVLPVPSGALTDWYEALPYPLLESMPFSNAALIAAYSVFLVNSANVVVRATLTLTDSRIQRSELRIKGGRVIGPIERLFLFWMALAGQLLAIGAIVAAKGILRYPEISEREGKKSRGALAEYVLIGSLVSWGLALVLVPLLAVG